MLLVFHIIMSSFIKPNLRKTLKPSHNESKRLMKTDGINSRDLVLDIFRSSSF